MIEKNLCLSLNKFLDILVIFFQDDMLNERKFELKHGSSVEQIGERVKCV